MKMIWGCKLFFMMCQVQIEIWHHVTFYINPVKTKRRPLYLKTQSVPRCKHFSSRL